MEAALIILASIVAVGLVLYIHHRLTSTPPRTEGGETTDSSAAEDQPEEECCGMHITCEKDSLLSALSDKVVYYDDEELDVYAGRAADSYDGEEIERFRDVLLTLLPADIAGWARSIQLRGINLPEPVRDELIMIISEARAARQHA